MELSLGNDVMASGSFMERLLAAKRAAVSALAADLGRPDPFGPDEAARLSGIREAARAPASCGPDAPLAPARGRTVAYVPTAILPKGEEGYEVQHAGWRGRDAHRAADVWDVMQEQYERAGGRGQLFTDAQIATARAWARLVERHEARGLRCISVEAMMAGRSGGGQANDFADVLLVEAARIAWVREAIGDGVALEVRRAGKRSAITTARLVEMVAVWGRPLSAVLADHGWSDYGGVRATLRAALADALDRMAMVV